MPKNLAQFQEGDPSTIQSNDFVVGYDTAIPDGERRWRISTLGTSLSSVLRPALFGSITSLSGVELVAFVEKKATPSISGNALTLNLATASLFYVNLNASITSAINLTNIPTTPKVSSFILQFVFPDDTVRTVIWPSNTRWSAGSGPTLTCQTGKVDTFTFVTHDQGANWFAFIGEQNHF